VTVTALLLSLVSGAVLAASPTASWALLQLPLVLLARMALNAMDGILAREHGLCSALGARLNEMGDVVSDAALYLPLALVPGVAAVPMWLIVLLGTFAEMAGVVAVQIGATRRYDGPLGKSDRAFLFGFVVLLPGIGVSPGIWLDVLLWAGVVLSGLTVFDRSRGALAEVSG
jgi:CDP-diacylglycerol--glycerol-3-phosphate 3-phosphatidyltransferase